ERHAFHQRARFFRIGGGAHAEAVGAQIFLQERTQALIVVDDEEMRIVGGGAHGFAPRGLRSGSARAASTRRKPSTASGPASRKARANRGRCASQRAASSASPFAVSRSWRMRRSSGAGRRSTKPWLKRSFSTRLRLCLVILRIESKAATESPGLRAMKCSAR